MKKRIISLMIVIVLAISLLPMSALAADSPEWIEVPGIEGGKILFDSSSGTIEDCEESVTIANIPSVIDSVRVTTIGAESFKGCAELTSVTIPNSVTIIEEFAFSECSKLESIKLPDGLASIEKGMFSLCFSLKSISIPESVTAIRYSAFWGCTNMPQISIPSSVSYINSHSFWFCDSLTDIYYDGSKNAWDAITGGMTSFTGSDGTIHVTVHYSLDSTSNSETDLCKVSLYCADEEKGAASGIVVGSGAYVKGMVATVSAIPDEGYQFEGWYANGELVSNSTNYKFVVSGDVQLDAKFERIVCYTLSFDSNGGSTINSITAVPGEKIDLSQYTPTKNGYTFEGWYSDKAMTELVLTAKFTKNTTIYAKWSANKVGLSNFVKQNTYVDGQFTDVPSFEWYAESVRNAYELDLVKGVSDTIFRPDGNLTIAEALALACRLHSIYYTGSGEFQQGSPWYQVYVDYAINSGIITEGTYSNYNVVATRAQFASIFAKALPNDALKAINTVSAIPDVPTSASYANAVYLLYNAGILTGNDEYGTFNPERTIKRSEVSAIVSRMAVQTQRKSFSLKKMVSFVVSNTSLTIDRKSTATISVKELNDNVDLSCQYYSNYVNVEWVGDNLIIYPLRTGTTTITIYDKKNPSDTVDITLKITETYTLEEYYDLARAACEYAKKKTPYPHSFDLLSAEAGTYDGSPAVQLDYFILDSSGKSEWVIAAFTGNAGGRIHMFSMRQIPLEYDFTSTSRLDVNLILQNQ